QQCYRGLSRLPQCCPRLPGGKRDSHFAEHSFMSPCERPWQGFDTSYNQLLSERRRSQAASHACERGKLLDIKLGALSAPELLVKLGTQREQRHQVRVIQRARRFCVCKQGEGPSIVSHLSKLPCVLNRCTCLSESYMNRKDIAKQGKEDVS